MPRFLFFLGIIFFFSGCDFIDQISGKFSEVQKITKTVQELQQNIEATKEDLDTKLRQIEEAQEALSKVFGTSNETAEVKALKEQAIELQTRLDRLEKQNINSLEDTSEFSIE